jgi:arginine utilization protein RocB
VFLGALGKMLPAFYCAGLDAHVGNYYRGLSSALLSSHIICAAEGSPELADPERGVCHPSWICLENRIISEGYSVTVPKKSITYFNCFVARKSPADVMEDMKNIARTAIERTLEQLGQSHAALSRMGYEPKLTEARPRVLYFSELRGTASAALGGNEALDRRISEILSQIHGADARDRGLAALEEMIRLSGVTPPFIAVGFLPPYIPPRTSLDGDPSRTPLLRAVDRMIEKAGEHYGVTIDKAEFFAGLCDLSYMGFSGGADEASAFTDNCPGADKLFRVPFEDMTFIDMPAANFSVCGYDAHRMTERLDADYSLRILPELIIFALKALSEEWDSDQLQISIDV